MIGAIARFFCGEVQMYIEAPRHIAANIFIYSGLPVYDFHAYREGCAFSVEHRDKKAVCVLCMQKGLPCTVLKEKGVLPFLKKLCCRPGLAVGIVLSLFLLWQSSNYVWDIRVYGNQRLSDEEIVEILSKNGFAIGSRHSAMDLHELCNKIPIGNKDIAWISVNMMGSVAEIQVVEMVKKPDEKDPVKEELVNLVASREGQILWFELSSGRAVVSVGQTVQKGQMLVAGFSEKETGLHPKISAGKVYARTMLFKECFVPYETTVKEAGKPVLVSKSVNILGKEIFFYKKGRLLEGECDTIHDNYRPTVLGVSLPLRISKCYQLPYSTHTVLSAKEEVKEQGKKEIYAALSKEGAEILNIEFFFEEKEDGVSVVCQAECILDIAKKVSVTVTPQDSADG